MRKSLITGARDYHKTFQFISENTRSREDISHVIPDRTRGKGATMPSLKLIKLTAIALVIRSCYMVVYLANYLKTCQTEHYISIIYLKAKNDVLNIYLRVL